MPPEILTLLSSLGLPGLGFVALWYILRHIEKRSNEKDQVIYEILRDGQKRIENLVQIVLEFSKEDTQNRAELKAAVDMLIESQQLMQNFCNRQNRGETT